MNTGWKLDGHLPSPRLLNGNRWANQSRQWRVEITQPIHSAWQNHKMLFGFIEHKHPICLRNDLKMNWELVLVQICRPAKLFDSQPDQNLLANQCFTSFPVRTLIIPELEQMWAFQIPNIRYLQNDLGCPSL